MVSSAHIRENVRVLQTSNMAVLKNQKGRFRIKINKEHGAEGSGKIK